MLSNVLHSLSPSATDSSNLRLVAIQTGSMHYLPPLPTAATPAPFREDAPRGSHAHFYYALEDVLVSHTPRLTWSVHRPSVILGASARSEYNLVLTLAAYALICRREGGKLVYPGNEFTCRNPCCHGSNAGMLAEQHIWAAAGNVAAGEFGAGQEAGSEVGWEWVAAMNGKGKVWKALVEEEGLVPTRLEEIANFEFVYVMTNFEFEMVSCMRKSREFGFRRRVDTMKSVRRWIWRLREMKIIPMH